MSEVVAPHDKYISGLVGLGLPVKVVHPIKPPTKLRLAVPVALFVVLRAREIRWIVVIKQHVRKNALGVPSVALIMT